MIRFLSFVILLLRLLSDIRHKVALATTAAVVVGLSSFIVVGTVATSVTAAQLVPTSVVNTPVNVAYPEPHAAAGLPLPTHYHAGLPILSKQTAPNGNSVAPVQHGGSVGVDTGSPSSTISGLSATALPGMVSAVKGPPASVELSLPSVQCEQNQQSTIIMSATATLQKSSPADRIVTWYWETRIDSGTAPSQPPINNTLTSQTVHAGDTTITFLATDSLQPMLQASWNTAYSYSIRLHITTPFDVASDWVSVPVATASCPSSPQ